jgi:DNA-binding transcriptional regulator YiaG
MTCPMCRRADLVTRPERYLFDGAGLPRVTLVNVDVARCPSCGHFEIVPQHVAQLLALIALCVVLKTSPLTANEIRFFRGFLGQTRVEFARAMRVGPDLVGRWERDEQSPHESEDRLARYWVAIRLPESDQLVEPFVIMQLDAGPLHLALRLTADGWQYTAL